MKYYSAVNKKICLTILYSSEEYQIQTFAGEYRDLKCLIQDRLFTDDFGQCGGMGRCGTCIVRICGMKEGSGFIRNEGTTLQRIAPGIEDIRLACQIPVDDRLSNVTIALM
ncbi:MAG: 2Fe-2S iron-sulfur cluster-binding protein [Daejeonella sp.]|uniref:2Fe-2S iron-sulfur cluster-binding protein n=1 Tax=Daejeonella sp. TaxID=2805397 RepID=UPI002733E08F|nr:2Fe-2S iron-sulfur cluster-binding protein [Daejeonella sp.]MDP3467197.1 2Fe-2S iron-sulfur cluster-binding protein [Daejeonella sp.]